MSEVASLSRACGGGEGGGVNNVLRGGGLWQTLRAPSASICSANL